MQEKKGSLLKSITIALMVLFIFALISLVISLFTTAKEGLSIKEYLYIIVMVVTFIVSLILIIIQIIKVKKAKKTAVNKE